MILKKGSNLSQVSHGLTWNFPYKRLLFFFFTFVVDVAVVFQAATAV